MQRGSAKLGQSFEQTLASESLAKETSFPMNVEKHATHFVHWKKEKAETRRLIEKEKRKSWCEKKQQYTI